MSGETSSGSDGLELRLSGIHVALDGVPAALAARLSAEWGRFVAAGSGASRPWMRLRVLPASDPGDPHAPFLPKAMRASLEAERACYEMPQGRAVIDHSGIGTIELYAADDAVAYYALLNFVRACLAWRLPDRGGALLHAAGLVIGGRAFVLAGTEGSGKSTWALHGGRGGARVLSDDLVLLDGAEERFEALASPFRSTHAVRDEPGRFPLAAILFPRHGAAAELRGISKLLVRGRILANLPFLAEGLERDARIATLVDRLVGEVPCAELSFAPDSSFVTLLRDWRAGS